MESCGVCGVLTKNMCSNCNQSFYCCEQHQKQDWKLHKKNCYPFKTAFDKVVGRHLIATRKIKPFEIILKEAPIVKGPLQITTPVCLGCLNEIDPNDYICCEKCGWPLCGKECPKICEHMPECTITCKRGKKINITEFTNPHPLYHSITTLRCLLLQNTDINNWKLFNDLESLENVRRGSNQWKSDLASVGKFIPKFYKTDLFSEEIIMNAVGILQINGHEVPTTEPPHVAVFYRASFLEHSCLPNLAKSFSKDGNIIIWAPQEIKKGSHLSICYSDSIWGALERRKHLMQTKLFKCKCIRCEDITEFETYYNALKCSNVHCLGPVLPFEISKWNDSWRCVKCNKEFKKVYVHQILEKAANDMNTMEPNMENLLKYIKHYENWLHRNHYYLCATKLQLVQIIGIDSKDLINITDEQLSIKLCYGKELIEIFEKIAKCETRLLGTLCFGLHSAIAENARRMTMRTNISQIHQLEESLLYVEKCCKYLQFECDIFMEGHIYNQAKINRDALRVVLST